MDLGRRGVAHVRADQLRGPRRGRLFRGHGRRGGGLLLAEPPLRRLHGLRHGDPERHGAARPSQTRRVRHGPQEGRLQVRQTVSLAGRLVLGAELAVVDLLPVDAGGGVGLVRPPLPALAEVAADRYLLRHHRAVAAQLRLQQRGALPDEHAQHHPRRRALARVRLERRGHRGAHPRHPRQLDPGAQGVEALHTGLVRRSRGNVFGGLVLVSDDFDGHRLRRHHAAEHSGV
mmetsp:Transcript_31647/g.90283  ORF Transcript_31647/g.90283 Transcript_31647/m.90283 type:complete len:231 (-) Transcript_31647:231-923(-)